MKKLIGLVLALAASSVGVLALTGAKKADAAACCPDCPTCDSPSGCCGK